MPLIKNEQDVKRPSQFLKYEVGGMGNQLMLRSHLYQIDKHYLNSVKRSVICRGKDECHYCAAGYRKDSEFNYLVLLNGENGFLDIKASVFYAIQDISKAQKKDTRQISWTVIKKGEKLNTEYTTSKDDNLAPEDYDRLNEELDKNTEKLVNMMERHEESLQENYIQYMSQIQDQRPPKVSGVMEAQAPKNAKERAAMNDINSTLRRTKSSDDEAVDPSDIPF